MTRKAPGPVRDDGAAHRASGVVAIQTTDMVEAVAA
jgi:hypothetical protein